jgi:GNAT superfamily N-acetyltransferase
VLDVIETFNDAATGRPEPARRLAVLVRDASGKVQGGAWAVSYYDWLFIDLLYLPPDVRKQGWGSRIMRAIEREAVRRGCVGVWVDTMTFQAPLFYPRFGYEAFAGIKDYVAGHDHLWFRKTALSGGPVDAGLDIDSEPDPADRELLDSELGAFNDAIAGPANRSRLAVLLRETEDGPVLGGLIGRIGRGWLFIELLALPQAARKQGIGTRMMAMAEAAAVAKGCRGIWLDTFSWQAQPFYERLGYTALGRIEQYPGRHSRTLLAKRLDGGPRLASVIAGAAA